MPEVQQPTQLSQNPISSNPAGIRVHKKTLLMFIIAALLLCVFVIITYLNVNLIRAYFGLNTSAVSDVPGYTFTIENKKALKEYLLEYKFFSKNVLVPGGGNAHPSTVVFRLVPKVQPHNKNVGPNNMPVSSVGEYYNPKTKILTVALHIDGTMLSKLSESNLSNLASSEIVFLLYQITFNKPMDDMKEIAKIRTQIGKSLAEKKQPVFQIKKL